MFSFMKIATFAALAFGTLASALPSPAPSPEIKELVARQSAAPDLTTILTNLNNDLQGPVGQLNALSSSDYTPDKIKPIVIDIQVIIEAAVTAGKGKPAGSGDLLVLLSVVINLIIVPFGKIFVFPGVVQVDLIVVFQLIDGVLAALIQLVLGLVGGLLVTVLALLTGLLGGVVSIILELKLTAVISVLLL